MTTTTSLAGFRLSPQQRHLWRRAEREGLGAAPYRTVAALTLSGDLDPERLARAFAALLARHEILRTAFRSLPSMSLPLQAPLAAGVRLERSDLAGLDAAERDRALARRCDELARYPFDTAGGEGLCGHLSRLGDARWALLLAAPGLCCDGPGMRNVIEELAREYAGARGGDGDGAPQYVDLADFLNELQEAEDTTAGREFWRREGARLPRARRRLPGEPDGAAAAPFAPASVPVELAPGTARRLFDLAAAQGIAPQSVLLAAWLAVLARSFGEASPAVGWLADGRPYAELADSPGPFARYLPLAVPLAAGADLRRFAAQAGAAAAEAVRWQETFDWTALAADSGDEPPFCTLAFRCETAPPPARFGAARAVWDRLRWYPDRVGLELGCLLGEDELAAEVSYDAAVCDHAGAARHARRFAVLLAAALAAPERPLLELALLDAAERDLVLSAANATARPFAAAPAFHRLFEEHAARAPEAPALVYEGERLTYGELDAAANRLARHLRRLGVGPEVVVALALRRSADAVLAMLAVMKAGGAYLPLDPALPPRRLAHLLADSGAAVVLAHAQLLAALPAGRPAICLDAAERPWEALSPAALAPSADPANLAYVLYTSGSTGRPKGVAVEHRQVLNYFFALAERLELPRGLAYATVSTLAADLGNTAILGALGTGGCLHVVAQERLADAERMAAYLRDERIDVLKVVPSHLQALLGSPAAALPRSALVLGGEACPLPLVERALALAPGCRVFNHYGPTETTVGVLVHAAAPAGPPPGCATLPVGRPLANCRAYLVDPQLAPVPLDAPGELLIGGAAVARGYLGRPDLTAERFLPDPFGGEPGARLYRTGDLARRHAGGEIEFLGRVDHQVKVRGFRVELGEIEAALRLHPAVAAAVARLAPREGGEGRLVAYYVPAAEAEPSAAELRRWLAERLPEYMVPAALLPLAALPLTPNGKVDRAALPAPEDAAGGAQPGYQAPRTPAEEMLAETFAEVLGLPRVGIDDGFFALGGHSLMATQLVSRLRRLFEAEVSLQSLFDHPTVRGLAAALAAGGGDPAPRPPIERRPRGGRLPVSFGQQRLWFIEQLEPGRPTYNLPIVLELRGPLSAAALAWTLDEVIRRHEVLRTTFVAVEGLPWQLVGEPRRQPLPRIDLAALPPASRAAEARRLAAAAARLPFDLARGPLLRAALIRLGGEEHLLSATLHHIAGDRWSMGIFAREVAALYDAASQGAPSPLPELPFQYADFAWWQRAWLTGEALERQLGYWRESLAGAPPVLALPTDRPRPPAASGEGASLPVALSAARVAALRELGRREGATLFMTLLAGLQLLLARWAHQPDVNVGVPIAGRQEPDAERLIGCFVNTLVLRGRPLPGLALPELLRQVRSAALGAYAHQDLPFERLVEELEPQRSLSHTPLFQVAFAFQNIAVGVPELAGLEVRSLDLDTDTAKFDLTLSLAEGDAGLGGSLEYSRDLFDGATARRLIEQLERLLAAMAASPGARLGELPLLGEADRQQLLVEWNDTAVEVPAGVCLHHLFERQARRTPRATALIDGARRLTYAELDRDAELVARRLRQLGVGPEAVVGICSPRTAALVAGMLGILKAGGAYLPLDADYPHERLAYMVRDAGAAQLLASRRVAAQVAGARWEGEPLWLEDLLAAPAAAQPSEAAAPAPANLAYLIYTSGSTGRPKGVAIAHGSAVVFVGWALAAFAPDELACVLASTSVCFDMSIFEIFVPLAGGGTVAMADNVLALPGLPAAGEVRLINTVPSAGAALLALGPLPAGVRTVNLGGEALKQELVEDFHRRPGVARVYNFYGPSEDTTYSTGMRLEPGSGRGALIGRQVARTRAYLLDERLEPVGLGLLGELYLGGDGLARGYLGRPDLTAARFVPDPFAASPGARLYRTGDLARWHADSYLDYLGRVDSQVKIRGFRIEPGEIETSLAEHPAVRDAAVLSQPGADGDLELVAYVEGKGDRMPAEAELRGYLGGRLPKHLVPARIVALAALPRNANGKIDRLALRPPAEPEPAAEPVPGVASWVEEVMHGIWVEVLGREGIGLHDSFFDLGGHSLLATRLISRIVRTFQVEVPLNQLFQAPTIAGIAALVEEQMRSARAPRGPALEPRQRKGPAALSLAQQRLWLSDRLDPGAFLVRTALRLRGALDREALRRGLEEIVRRHEALRTRFPLVAGEPVQVVAPAGRFDLAAIELRRLDPARRDREAQHLANLEARRPFDLAAGPPFRALLLALGPEDHVLLVTMHHIVSDAWSLQILVQEVVTLYAAFTQGRPSPLPELPVQYADFAEWQRRWLASPALETTLAYWRRQLTALPVVELRTDRPRPPVQTFHGASRAFELGARPLAALRELCREENVTLFALLTTALAVVLAERGGQREIVVGTNLANRGRPEVQGVIGCFINSLVLRLDLAGAPTFRDALRRTWQVAMEAYAHGDLPFERLVEAVSPRRDPSRAPLFQVKVELQNAAPGTIETPGLAVSAVEIERAWAHDDLLLYAEEAPDHLLGLVRYNRDLFVEESAALLARQLAAALEAAASDPDVPLPRLYEALGDLKSERRRQREAIAQQTAQLELRRLERRAARPAVTTTGD